MHPNPAFRPAGRRENLAFARERGFGMLTVSGGGAPLIAHVPFLLSENGEILELHLLRSNPVARLLDAPLPTRIAVSGPDGYISPDWYGMADQVPTWNYVAVHLTGRLERSPQESLRDLLDRQVAQFEERLRPKPPWTTTKMKPETLARMMRAVLPCRMRIEAVDGTWKLGQNKPKTSRQSAADHLDGGGQGAETRVLAALMRGANQS